MCNSRDIRSVIGRDENRKAPAFPCIKLYLLKFAEAEV